MTAPAFVAQGLDPAIQKLWSADIAHDAVKHCFFLHFVDSATKFEGQRRLLKAALGSKDFGAKYRGMGWIHEDFKAKKGTNLTITHVPNVYGEPIFGEGILAGGGMSQQPDVLELGFDVLGQGIENSGKYSDQAFVFDTAEEAKAGMGLWAGLTTEEIIAFMVWGIKTPANSVFKNLKNPAGYTTLLNNAVTVVDATHTLYAGGKSQASAITSADKLSAQFLSLAFTTATEDLDIPMRTFEDESLIMLGQRRAIEQVTYDPVWRYAMRAAGNSTSNPMVQGNAGHMTEPYDGIRLCTYNRAPNPAANVGQSMLLGKDAFHVVKVQEWQIDQVYTDVLKRRWMIAVDAMFGVIPHIIKNLRQNSMALVHYVRS